MRAMNIELVLSIVTCCILLISGVRLICACNRVIRSCGRVIKTIDDNLARKPR